MWMQTEWQTELLASIPALFAAQEQQAHTLPKTEHTSELCRTRPMHPAVVPGTHCVAELMLLLVAAAAQQW
jgi:hypothetical protein